MRDRAPRARSDADPGSDEIGQKWRLSGVLAQRGVARHGVLLVFWLAVPQTRSKGGVRLLRLRCPPLFLSPEGGRPFGVFSGSRPASFGTSRLCAAPGQVCRRGQKGAGGAGSVPGRDSPPAGEWGTPARPRPGSRWHRPDTPGVRSRRASRSGRAPGTPHGHPLPAHSPTPRSDSSKWQPGDSAEDLGSPRDQINFTRS